RGELVELRNYSSPAWADTIADRTANGTSAISDFLVRVEREGALPTAVTANGEGEIAGVRYRIHGQGPALVLMPLSLAPSQWEPLVQGLTNYYGVIVLSGAHLGIISLLEERARSGYGELVAKCWTERRSRSGRGCRRSDVVRVPSRALSPIGWVAPIRLLRP